MDGENNGNPYLKWGDLGGKPTILGNPQIEPNISYNTQKPCMQENETTIRNTPKTASIHSCFLEGGNTEPFGGNFSH